MKYAIHTDSDALSGQAKEFFEKVKNEQDEPELNNDYPYAYVVEVGDQAYIAFKSNLPESREPWSAGFIAFERDDVISVNDDGTLDLLTGPMESAPEAVDDLLDLVDI